MSKKNWIESLGYTFDPEYPFRGQMHDGPTGKKDWCVKDRRPLVIIAAYVPDGLRSWNLVLKCPDCGMEMFGGT